MEKRIDEDYSAQLNRTTIYDAIRDLIVTNKPLKGLGGVLEMKDGTNIRMSAVFAVGSMAVRLHRIVHYWQDGRPTPPDDLPDNALDLGVDVFSAVSKYFQRSADGKVHTEVAFFQGTNEHGENLLIAGVRGEDKIAVLKKLMRQWRDQHGSYIEYGHETFDEADNVEGIVENGGGI